MILELTGKMEIESVPSFLGGFNFQEGEKKLKRENPMVRGYAAREVSGKVELFLCLNNGKTDLSTKRVKLPTYTTTVPENTFFL